MDEVEKLKTEIKILNKRLAIIEARESRKSAYKKIKFVINLVIVTLTFYGLWYLYDYVKNTVPTQIENGINELIPDDFN